MQAIATEFRDERNAWLEVWNEPYWWQGGRGDTDDRWLTDMQDMVDNIRSTGNRNLMLVPGAESGQAESVLLTKGAQLLQGRSNILFDIHAYEKWLLGTSPASVAARIQAVQGAGLALIFGQISPFNSGAQMDVRIVLDAARVGTRRRDRVGVEGRRLGSDRAAHGHRCTERRRQCGAGFDVPQFPATDRDAAGTIDTQVNAPAPVSARSRRSAAAVARPAICSAATQMRFDACQCHTRAVFRPDHGTQRRRRVAQPHIRAREAQCTCQRVRRQIAPADGRR